MDPESNEKKKKVIKVKVNDKRRTAKSARAEGGAEASPSEAARSAPPSGGGDLHGAHTEHAAPPAAGSSLDDDRPLEPAPLPQTPPPPGSSEGSPDYLDDLKRLQADFDNYRKRMMRDQTSVAERASARVLEGLLPVLDNFERAIAHGEGGEGVQLVFKDLRTALEREGLEEVPGEGVEFDPNVHDAVESREVEGLEQPTVIEVYRRGYLHKGQLLRAAMVVVGRPKDEAGTTAESERETATGTEGSG